MYQELADTFPKHKLAGQAQSAIEAVSVDSRAQGLLQWSDKEVAPVTPSGYGRSGMATVVIANDTLNGVEVLFSAMGPASQSATIEACPNCATYQNSRPYVNQTRAHEITLYLRPGTYAFVLIGDDGTILTIPAWTLLSGRTYDTVYYQTE